MRGPDNCLAVVVASVVAEEIAAGLAVAVPLQEGIAPNVVEFRDRLPDCINGQIRKRQSIPHPKSQRLCCCQSLF
ncbi:hypothetical protein BJA5080_04102 [Bradyrhizobium diazoefficiens SEMIA 5080]|uniref:Uncharacterized protein n=1 Tax=Bradyrhizobium diazoefficiens SEMIA 5080 TaxID=754504 RepID=A0A837CLV6_9BRAD|nr:hypothetical protein BJA5080_04102 [Bradyrhizobium diazoefficiens SEMIA 5080]